jgi:hypothetical protein
MVEKGFLKTIHKQLVLVSENADDLLEKMRTYQPPDLGQFITEERT